MDQSHFEAVRNHWLSGLGASMPSGTSGSSSSLGLSGTSALSSASGSSIGTLGEKALHAITKSYIEPDASHHEIKIATYHVDCFDGTQIHEIQTRHFHKLNAKLATLLPLYPVTVVYPMPARKWLLWIDPLTGEVTNPRLSPKRGNPHDIFRELYRIKPHLSHPHFSLRILQMDLEEYRWLNGWSEDRKKGSHRRDRLPLTLENEILIQTPADFQKLLPDSLPEIFTTSDYARLAKTSRSTAQMALNILGSLGVITTCGKQGRSIAWRRK